MSTGALRVSVLFRPPATCVCVCVCVCVCCVLCCVVCCVLCVVCCVSKKIFCQRTKHCNKRETRKRKNKDSSRKQASKQKRNKANTHTKGCAQCIPITTRSPTANALWCERRDGIVTVVPFQVLVGTS